MKRQGVMARLAAISLLSLLGCAAPGPPARPSDLPLQATEAGRFTLRWRLDRTDGVAVAVGVVEVAQPERISEVTLELEGLDRDGRLLSRAIGRAEPRTFSGDAPWPFTVRVRATGQEARFTLRVTDFTWKLMRAGS